MQAHEYVVSRRVCLFLAIFSVARGLVYSEVNQYYRRETIIAGSIEIAATNRANREVREKLLDSQTTNLPKTKRRAAISDSAEAITANTNPKVANAMAPGETPTRVDAIAARGVYAVLGITALKMGNAIADAI